MSKRLIRFDRTSLDSNYHGPACTTLRRTFLLVRMDSWVHHWTLYLYRGDGSCIGLGVAFPRWKGKQFGGKKK